ncbi:septal ring lytic transglycosylase RlpA family protein [Ignatzschineria sp. LJL83]
MAFLSTKKVIISLLAMFIIASCSSTTKSSNHTAKRNHKGAVPEDLPLSKSGNPKKYVVFGKTYHPMATSKGYREKGMASWYGDKFHGKPTSSGTPYDMHAYTAAHKTLPIPTYVVVTNTDTNKSITVLVNDRGPFVKGRIIDLSFAAAKELDVVQKGTAPVIVEALSPYQYLDPNKKPSRQKVDHIPTNQNTATTTASTSIPYQSPNAPSTIDSTSPNSFNNNVTIVEQQYFDQAPTTSGAFGTSGTNHDIAGYRIQLGSFGSEQNAVNFQQNITNSLQQNAQVKYDNGLYRVYIGNYNSREEAGNAAFAIPAPSTIVHF